MIWLTLMRNMTTIGCLIDPVSILILFPRELVRHIAESNVNHMLPRLCGHHLSCSLLFMSI